MPDLVYVEAHEASFGSSSACLKVSQPQAVVKSRHALTVLVRAVFAKAIVYRNAVKRGTHFSNKRALSVKSVGLRRHVHVRQGLDRRKAEREDPGLSFLRLTCQWPWSGPSPCLPFPAKRQRRRVLPATIPVIRESCSKGHGEPLRNPFRSHWRCRWHPNCRGS